MTQLQIFTIVLNGEPFIERQLEVARSLSMPFKWVFVEGPAKPVKDTAWCKELPLGSYCNIFRGNATYCASTDGTFDLIERAQMEHDGICHMVSDLPWHGKVDMCNAALSYFDAGPVIQIDVDEFWTKEQLEELARLLWMYQGMKRKLAFKFKCRYWITDKHRLVTDGAYGNYGTEWIRAWCWDGKSRFASHEPPFIEGTQGVVSLKNQPEFWFEHYAYATRKAVAFKEKYYGYDGAVAAWEKLRAENPQHGKIADWLPWVKDHAEFVGDTECLFREDHFA